MCALRIFSMIRPSLGEPAETECDVIQAASSGEEMFAGDDPQKTKPPPEMDVISVAAEWLLDPGETSVNVTIQGANPRDVYFVSSDLDRFRPGKIHPLPQSNPYTLQLIASSLLGTSAEELLEARLGSAGGPVGAQLGVKIYRPAERDPYKLWKIYHDGQTTPAYLDDINKDSVQDSTNEYIKACVMEVELQNGGGGGLVHVPYDDSAQNGILDIYFPGDGSWDRGPEYIKVWDECKPLDSAVIYVKNLQSHRGLSDDAEQGHTQITVAGGSVLCLGRQYTLWRHNADYSEMYSETVRFTSRDPEIPEKLYIEGGGLAHAYPKDTSYVILKLAGLCMHERGVYVSSSFYTSTLERVKWLFAHELMHHAGGLSDIGEVNNLMGDWTGTNLRFRQLPQFYKAEESESQWNRIVR